MIFEKKLTKRSVIKPLIVFCVLMTVMTATSVFAQTASTTGSNQPLVPAICPPEPGLQIPEKTSAVKSEPTLIPAQKPDQAVPGDTDFVTTPGPSALIRQMKTPVPGILPVPVPEALKKPISMDQALEIAFRNNPNIKSALSLVESKRGSVDAAKALFNPVFNATAYSKIQGPTSMMSTSPDTTASLSVSLPLDISRQLKYSSEIAQYQFQSQYLSMVTVSEQLIVDVKSAYYGLLRACGQRVVNQASVDEAKQRLDNIKAKYEEGAVPKYDVTSAEVELDNLNQELMASQNQVYLAQSSLNALLGVDVNYPTQILSVDVPVTISTVDIPESVDKAYAKRPEIKAAQSAVAISKTSVLLQKTGLLPSMSITAGAGYDANDNLFVNGDTSWSAMVMLNIPLNDGGTTKAKVRQAEAGIQSSIAILEQTKNMIANEVRQAALNLQNAALRTQTTSHAVSLAEDALQIAYDRYNSGVAVLVEVTNAQSQLARARYNYVNAQYDYADAFAKLQKATSSQPEINQLQLLADQKQVKPQVKEAQS